MDMGKNTVLSVFISSALCFFSNLSFGSDAFENGTLTKVNKSISNVKQEMQHELAKMRAAYNEETKLLRQQTATIFKELQNFSEIIQVVLNQNSELKNKIAKLERENGRLKDDLSSQIRKLEMFIGEEQTARIKADQDIVKEVSSEIARIVSSINTSPSLSSRQGSVEHSIYEVVKGDTLSAISMAFGVSLKRLMAYNNLSDTTIFIGQKIKIPEN